MAPLSRICSEGGVLCSCLLSSLVFIIPGICCPLCLLFPTIVGCSLVLVTPHIGHSPVLVVPCVGCSLPFVVAIPC